MRKAQRLTFQLLSIFIAYLLLLMPSERGLYYVLINKEHSRYHGRRILHKIALQFSR